MVPKEKNTGRVVGYVACIAFILGMLIFATSSKFLVLGWKNAFGNGEGFYSNSQTSMTDLERRSEANIVLTVDSILSVIQGYYFDKSRVDNKSLVEVGFGVLKKFPGVRVSDQNGKYLVQYFSKKITFKKMIKPNYADVLAWFTRIESFLVTANPELKPFSFSKSFLLTLDAHSAFLSPEDYLDLRQGTEGVFGGLGVLVGMRRSVLTVIKPIPASPAYKHGIASLDKILSINGVTTFGANIDNLIEVMRGAPGTEVTMSLLRQDALGPEELKIKREIIEVKSVASHVTTGPKGNVLHLTIDTFSSRTAQEVAEHLKNFKQKYEAPRGVILDLRSNPGGLLDQAVAVADMFLDNGVIVATKGRREEIEYVSSREHDTTTPMIVLIDGDSASASEIVAGALQDHNRALIVGQRSFGKGSVQTVFELPGDTAVKITIARYYTPKGRSIQSYGIVPDINLLGVKKTEENKNIFSFNRYRSEAFLENHLVNDDQTKDVWSKSSFEGLYLSDDKDDFESVKNDEEISLSNFILGKLFEDGVSEVHPFLASNLIARHADDLSHWLEAKNTAVMSWLDKKFNVNWSEGSAEGQKIDIRANVLEMALPGRPLTLKYSVYNRGAQPSGRVSVFVRSELGLGNESLMGKLTPHTSISDRMQINIPSHFSSGRHFLDVGIALNGNPIDSSIIKVPIKVQERGYSYLRTQLSLEDGHGGNVQNVLEAGEDAHLILTISNDSISKMSEIEICLESLTGKQTALIEGSSTVNELLPRQSMRLRFPVKGFDKVISKVLQFGVHIDSPDLRSPWDGTFAINALPGEKKIQPSQNSLAH